MEKIAEITDLATFYQDIKPDYNTLFAKLDVLAFAGYYLRYDNKNKDRKPSGFYSADNKHLIPVADVIKMKKIDLLIKIYKQKTQEDTLIIAPLFNRKMLIAVVFILGLSFGAVFTSSFNSVIVIYIILLPIIGIMLVFAYNYFQKISQAKEKGEIENHINKMNEKELLKQIRWHIDEYETTEHEVNQFIRNLDRKLIIGYGRDELREIYLVLKRTIFSNLSILNINKLIELIEKDNMIEYFVEMDNSYFIDRKYFIKMNGLNFMEIANEMAKNIFNSKYYRQRFDEEIRGSYEQYPFNFRNNESDFYNKLEGICLNPFVPQCVKSIEFIEKGDNKIVKVVLEILSKRTWTHYLEEHFFDITGCSNVDIDIIKNKIGKGMCN